MTTTPHPNGANGTNGTKITTSQVMLGVLSAAGITGVGVVVLSVFGGPDSGTATNSLLLVMTPIITGLMAVLVAKMTEIHKQMDGMRTEILALSTSEAYAQGAKDQSVVSAQKAKVQADETATITADVAATALSDAEQRKPPPTG